MDFKANEDGICSTRRLKVNWYGEYAVEYWRGGGGGVFSFIGMTFGTVGGITGDELGIGASVGSGPNA